MVFSSILFLFKFLPIVFLIYYIIPAKFKNLALVIFSLIFYSWGEVRYFPLMVATITVNYFISLGIERWREKPHVKKLLLAVAVVCGIGSLLFFKYTNFFISNINSVFGTSIQELDLVLPLGISFYTFQTLAYTIDVYRGKTAPEKNIINFGAFVVMFPQLIAGPIVNYTHISSALKSRRIDIDKVTEGIKIFIFGLGKKVLIANNIGALWTQVQTTGIENTSTPLAWLGVFAFGFQIYFDFSGYSMMAIGLGKMLGFDFPKNFDFPYISKSATEFWRRWHITLGAWFREYLYIPLGGSRRSKIRNYINIILVWAATGFWHGASWNFVVWGLMFAVLIIIEKLWLLKLLEKSKILSHIYLIFFAMLGWGIFAMDDFTSLAKLFGKLFSFSGGSDWIYYLRNYGVVFLIAIFCSIPLVQKIYDKIKRSTIAEAALLVVIFVLSTAYLVDATYNPFLYFRF
ncbi:MAG: MBOAT family protein [Oscillospiraceae bacterium]|nr:MBOAT family protein [Oscillospiraceae bacterium]